MDKIKLPPLSANELGKLDVLITFMKENKNEYINVNKFCKEKWGDNRLLYIFFAEYLKKNSFAIIQTDKKGPEYVWEQKISQEGFKLNSFKNAYRIQAKKEEILLKASRQSLSLKEIGHKFLVTSLTISLVCSALVSYANKVPWLEKIEPIGNLQEVVKKTWKTIAISPFI